MRIDRPAADVDDRLTCGHQGLQGAFNLPFMATGGWVIRAHAHCVRPDVRQLLRRIENILRQIDHYRTGATAGRQPEGFLQHAGNIFGLLHQETVLHHRTGNPHHVALLEGIVADKRGGYLPREDHQRNRVHIGCRNASDGVRRPRPRGHQHHADLPGRPRQAIRHMHRRLLVTNQHMIDTAKGM